MHNYKHLIEKILDCGQPRTDRTGVGTLGLFDEQLKFDLQAGFPLVTGKFTSAKTVAEELKWMLSGSTAVADLPNKIWDAWELQDGTIGPTYGLQWRACPKLETNNPVMFPERNFITTLNSEAVDQIDGLINGLKSDPFSRRHILNSWNVGMVHMMALTPCHAMAQFYVDNSYILHCKMFQRSADVFLGLPYNIASYAMLTHLLAYVTGLQVGILTIDLGDVHLYSNHIEAADLYLTRQLFDLPEFKCVVVDKTLRTGFDFELNGYEHGGVIRAEVAV